MSIDNEKASGHAVDFKGQPSPKESTEGLIIDPEAERRLVRKLDWILLPLFTLVCE